MARGGPRNRGPLVRQPNSEAARMRRAGAVVLPADGYQGPPPPFPLPDPSDRELVVWAEAWSTPQADAWAEESWRWHTIGLWCRWSTRMEDPEAPAALGNVVIRLADQCGLSPAGLTENGWRIADPEDQPLRVVPSQRRDRPGISVRDRLRSAPDLDAPMPALERARQRAEGRDPRDHLHDGD